eukprot:2574166-Karenia_brevis.AAC.1
MAGTHSSCLESTLDQFPSWPAAQHAVRCKKLNPTNPTEQLGLHTLLTMQDVISLPLGRQLIMQRCHVEMQYWVSKCEILKARGTDSLTQC